MKQWLLVRKIIVEMEMYDIALLPFGRWYFYKERYHSLGVGGSLDVSWEKKNKISNLGCPCEFPRIPLALLG